MIETNLSSIALLLSKKEETGQRRSCKLNELRAAGSWQKVCWIAEQHRVDECPGGDLELLERAVNQSSLLHMYWQLAGPSLSGQPPEHAPLQAALQNALLHAIDTQNSQQVT